MTGRLHPYRIRGDRWGRRWECTWAGRECVARSWTEDAVLRKARRQRRRERFVGLAALVAKDAGPVE